MVKMPFHAPLLLGLLFDAHELLAFARATPAAVIFVLATTLSLFAHAKSLNLSAQVARWSSESKNGGTTPILK